MSGFDITQVIVRDATADDLSPLDALRPMGVRHADRIRQARPDLFRFLVADLDDRIVGMVLLYFRAEPGWDRGYQMPLLLDLFVQPELRSLGIGTALVRAAEEFAIVKGFGHLYLRVEPDRNPRAFQLCKRLGYQALQSKPYEDAFHFVDSAGNVEQGIEWVVDMRKWLA